MKKKALAIASAILLLLAAIGVTVAFMFGRTEANNVFFPAEISCTVHEKLDGADFTAGTHHGFEKHDIHVENTGNYPAYIRVRLVSYWVDVENNIVGLPSVSPNVTLHDHWLVSSDGTYYYDTPVSPGELTGGLCEPLILQTSVDAGGNTVYQAIDVIAEAIQANPAGAVQDAWRVRVGTDGTLSLS